MTTCTKCNEKDQLVARLRELLGEVMGEGVEYSNDKYAVVQMSHVLRATIRVELFDGSESLLAPPPPYAQEPRHDD